MKTELTCDLDSNANQNENLDDGNFHDFFHYFNGQKIKICRFTEPYPPPGLRRLVTGQTISFDDGPASPPFDRIIPGEGNTFNNYPQPPKMSKPPNDPYVNDNALSERVVSGSTSKEYNPSPYPGFAAPPPMKKDNINVYSNTNFYSNEKNTFNSSSQDFFDAHLRSGTGEDENILKANQYPKNKFASLPSGFQNYDADKRNNYFQAEKPNVPKLPPSTCNDDFNKNINPPFLANYPPRSNNHMQEKVLKPVENIQYTNMENKPQDNAYSQNRRPSCENYAHEPPPFAVNYENNYQKYHMIPQRNYEENPVEKARNEPNYANKQDNFQICDPNYYPSQVENTIDNQAYDKDKYRSDYDRHKNNEPYDMDSGRMAIEGSSDNASYSKPAPSIQMQSANYDYWYSNNSQKAFAEMDVKNNDSKLLKEQNTFYGKYRNDHRGDDKPHNLQNVQPVDSASPRLNSPASANALPLVNPYENISMHKSQSASSNTSLNENMYQQNESYGHENLAKRYEHPNKPEKDNAGPYEGHNFRANENIDKKPVRPVKANVLEVQQTESENFPDVKPFPQQNESVEGYAAQLFQNFETVPTEEAPLNSAEQFISKNHENYINPEDAFASRDLRKDPQVHDTFVNRDVRKDPQLVHERSFVDQRKPANTTLLAPGVENIAKEINLKSPYRKTSVVNEERIDSDGLTLERGTVPGAQSTPNDNQPNRSFINANNSNYNSANLFKTIEGMVYSDFFYEFCENFY